MSDLDSSIRRNILATFLLLAVLVLGVAVLSTYYEAELKQACTAIYDTLGLPGLFAILFVSDAVFSPIPPDLILVVLSQTPHDDHWFLLALAIGLQSVFAGCTGWYLGSRLGQTRWSELVLGRFRERGQALVLRHGRLGVALAAATPIPFSLTCWAAGMLNMPFRLFLAPCWLRIPRFIGYYAAITYAEELARWWS